VIGKFRWKQINYGPTTIGLGWPKEKWMDLLSFIDGSDEEEAID
jgi:hypothetical protein